MKIPFTETREIAKRFVKRNEDVRIAMLSMRCYSILGRQVNTNAVQRKIGNFLVSGYDWWLNKPWN